MNDTVRGPRKKSPRGKGKRNISAASARLKELWQTPEFREKMRLRNEHTAALREANPAKFNRAGVPDGMRRAQAEPLWARARKLADRFIQLMKETDQLPTLPMEAIAVPETDAAKAEVALREAFILAVGPSDQKIKIQAINTVLNFTKSKPESRSKLTLNKAEDFLDAIASDEN